MRKLVLLLSGILMIISLKGLYLFGIDNGNILIIMLFLNLFFLLGIVVSFIASQLTMSVIMSMKNSKDGSVRVCLTLFNLKTSVRVFQVVWLVGACVMSLYSTESPIGVLINIVGMIANFFLSVLTFISIISIVKKESKNSL